MVKHTSPYSYSGKAHICIIWSRPTYPHYIIIICCLNSTIVRNISYIVEVQSLASISNFHQITISPRAGDCRGKRRSLWYVINRDKLTNTTSSALDVWIVRKYDTLVTSLNSNVSSVFPILNKSPLSAKLGVIFVLSMSTCIHKPWYCRATVQHGSIQHEF